MILAIGTMGPIVRERLSEYGDVVEVAIDDRAEIERLLPQAIAIAARANADLGTAVIEAAPQLRVIGRTGVGTDLVDLETATRRGVPVVVTPDSGTRAVAEGAVALILHLVKGLDAFTKTVRAGDWSQRETLPIGDLDGATIGIVGYGRIGRRLGEIASFLGMRVLAFDPYAAPGTDEQPVTDDLGSVLREADVISLHAPLTPETRGLIDGHALAQMKPGAFLVNCGRGGLLDLDAALDALSDGRLAGLGLDVYDPEPPADHPVFHHPNTVLTPHVMGLSQRARRLAFVQMADGMADVLSGRRPPHVANPDVLEHASR